MTAQDQQTRTLPYPRSDVFSRLEWLAPASRYPGSGTDMHWHAWADDDALYFVDDDGANFGQPWNFAHLLRATGTPPDFRLEEVSRFPELKRPESLKYQRYVDGALAIGSRLYVAAYDYDDLDETGEREFWFVDAVSRNGGIAALMYSDDYGRTWHNAPDPTTAEETPYFLGPRFAGLAFVGFGRGYTGVPDRLGDYVYAISNDGNWESGDNVFLARAPRASVLDRGTWEFYAGEANGRGEDDATWTTNEDATRPILSDPGHVGHPTMTYSAGLDRFLLTFGSDEVPHTWEAAPETIKATWHRRRELCVYEGPTPWGPWGLVHHDPYWEGEHVAYLPQVPPKWLSVDGRSGWLVFSGDYGHYDGQPSDELNFYGFMTRPFRLQE